MKKLLASLIIFGALLVGAVETRIYEGPVNGAVVILGTAIEQSGRALVEIEGDKTSSVFKVRAKALEAPSYLSKTNWSNVITAMGVTNNPFRTSFSNKDFVGRCAISHAEDWSSLVIAASSKVTGIDVLVYPSTLKLIDTRQGGLAVAIPVKQPPKSLDAVDVTGHKAGYKGGKGPQLDKMQITKQAFTAKISSRSVTMSGADRSGYETKSVKGATCNGKAWIGWYLADGTLFFGHYDWLRVGQNSKGMENVHNGLLKGPDGIIHIPPRGATIYVCQTDVNYKQRSPVIKAEGVW